MLVIILSVALIFASIFVADSRDFNNQLNFKKNEKEKEKN